MTSKARRQPPLADFEADSVELFRRLVARNAVRASIRAGVRWPDDESRPFAALARMADRRRESLVAALAETARSVQKA